MTVAMAALLIGASTGAFARIHSWMDRLEEGATDAVFGVLLVGGLAATVIALFRRQESRRESSLRTETEARFQAMVEQVPAVAYTWDTTLPTGQAPPVYVSPQLESMLGYTPEEWSEHPERWLEVMHPDDRERVRLASDEADRTGTAFHAEYRAFAKDGHMVWIRDDSVVVASDGKGGALRAQGVMYDITRQKQAEEGLQEAENRYRTIVERVPAVAYVWDSSHRPGSAPAGYISPQIERLLGFTPEVWLQDPTRWAAQLHPDDAEGVLRRWDEAVRSAGTFVSEYRIRSASGSQVWVRDEAVPVADGISGRPIYQGVMYDITEQRAAQDRLAVAEERYRSLVENLPVVTYVTDAEGADSGEDLRYIAPGVEALTGYNAQEWLASRDLWESLIHPEDRDQVISHSQETDRTLEPFDIDYRLIRKDGRTVWVHDHAVVVHNEKGATVWQGVMQDTTARRDAERALGRAEERYRSLVEQLPAVVYVDAVDDIATAQYISPQYERLTGYSPQQRLAEPELWVKMLHEDDREAILRESDRTNLTGEPFDVEYRIVRADGATRWVRDQAFLIQDPDGTQVWQGVLTDITDRKLAEEALRRRDRILEAAGYAAERLLRAPTWRECIDDVLRALGEGCTATRATLFENREIDGETNVALRHAWLAPDAPDRLERASSVAYPYGEDFERWRQVLGDGGVIHGAASDLPDRERGMVEGAGIKALIAVPVHVEGAWWGYIGFDQCDRDREWQPAEIDAIRVAANTLGGAIERERVAARLGETEARYRGLIETIPAVTYIDTVDALSDAVYTSPQIEDVFGYTVEQWTNDASLWEQGLHPEDRDEVIAKVERLNREGEQYQAEYRFVRPDGRVVWVSDHAVVLTDDEGNPCFSQGVFFDITARKEAEEHLREAEERYRAIVEHIPAAIYLDQADRSMRTVYISPQIEDIAGVTAEEWIADPELWLKIVPQEDREEVERSYIEAINQDRAWKAEYRMQTRDGRTIWVHDETTILHDADGNPTYLQGVLMDVTERKLAEQALRESELREREAAERLRALDEMKNTFLAAVSHELRSPLTSILGLSITLERSPEMDETDRQDLLSRLSINARKLERLLKDLLDIDRLNRGIVSPQYRTVDVGALARRTVESMDAVAERTVIVDASPVVLSVDPPKIERIVENLVMNAARHTTADRTIWLKVCPRDGGVLLTVDDDGPGVPMELREAIFEPFRQGPSASAHSPGTGIGLSLVGKFAALHGGSAWVQDRPGGGASFQVLLPAGPSAEEEPAEEEPAAEASARGMG
jgi:PAS domain S-box-containing protein